MGVLKGMDVSFDKLINVSKLQDLLELFLEELREHEQVVTPLREQVAELQSSQAAMQAQLDEQANELEESDGREASKRATSAGFVLEQLQELRSKMDEQEQFVAKLQTQEAGAEHSLDDLQQKVQGLLDKDQAREMAMVDGMELPLPIQNGIKAFIRPLEAAIAAMDAQIESQLVVRLEAHEARLGSHETVHENLLRALQSELERGPQSSPWSEEKMAAINDVKYEVSDLAKKLSEVTSCLSEMETQLVSQSMESMSGSRIFSDMLKEASEQLETRVASLEGHMKAGMNKDAQDLSAIGDSLRQVQNAAKSLEGIVSKDVRPKLDTHTSEMRRLAGELNGLCSRINDVVGKSSTATTVSLQHCLACFEARKQAASKVLIGTDGKTYIQGGGQAPSSRAEVSSTINWPPEDGKAFSKLRGSHTPGDKSAPHGGAGAPLRKYRIPLGTDGTPTWNLVKGDAGSTSSPILPAAVERGRGLPPPSVAAPGSRPQSASLPGVHGGSRPQTAGSVKLGIGSDAEV